MFVVAQKVVVFGSYAPSLVNFRGPLIAELISRGHSVYALAPDIESPVSEALRNLGAEPLAVPLARSSLNPLGAARTLWALREHFDELRPDVVIAYTIKPIVLGAAAARATNVARFVPIVTGLGYSFLGGRNLKRRLLRHVAVAMYRNALSSAHTVIFQNKDDRKDFRSLGVLKRGRPSVVVNGSGVDLEHFITRPLPTDLSFLMVARFLRDKGVREFIAAADRLRREHPHIKVRIAGWTDTSPDAISPTELAGAAATGIENLGYLADVRPALADCSVYVLPSYREGTPRSVLEAMATGRAIITTDAPGCRETVVPGENGWLVPPRDPEALYQAMLRFVDKPELCETMGAASRCLVERKYDVRRVNEVILQHAGL
jgi:glycosyltransferase involved in cell wall biosynthesis